MSRYEVPFVSIALPNFINLTLFVASLILGGCGSSGLSSGPGTINGGSSPSSPTPSPIILYNVPTAASLPVGITSGSDGNVWFVEGLNTVNQIARIDLSNDNITEIKLPGCAAAPEYVVSGSDSRLWMAAVCIGIPSTAVWAAVSTSGAGQLFEPGNNSNAFYEALGPDGNVWYTTDQLGLVGNVTPTGIETSYSLSEPGKPTHRPSGIAVGPDGDLWIAENAESYIDQITTNGAIVNEFNVPLLTDGITAGPDGNMWFTSYMGDEVGYITPGGRTTIFQLEDQCVPGSEGLVGPLSIKAGPDGNLWFTEQESYGMGRITPTGVVSSFCTPSTPYGPFDLTVGPDGNIWFTESGLNAVGKVILAYTKQEHGTRLRPIHPTLAQNCIRMASVYARRIKLGLANITGPKRSLQLDPLAWRRICQSRS